VPFWPIPPTVNSSGEYQAGETTVWTCFQPRGSDGTAALGGGFWVHSLPVHERHPASCDQGDYDSRHQRQPVYRALLAGVVARIGAPVPGFIGTTWLA
jgi:hypothetical protein